jgi:CheY-like chemotaxis protein
MATDTRMVGRADGGPVLLVEDNLRARATVRAMLEDEGLPVETAGDGREPVAID